MSLINRVLAAGAVAALSTSVASAAGLEVTEIYAGVSGPDGTADWFELTNKSGSSISTAGYYYDDDSVDPTKDDALDALTIAPGESVIFLTSWEDDFASSADAINTFVAFWGLLPSVQVGTVDGGSGLGGGGDEVNVFDGNTVAANIVASGSYPGGSVVIGGTAQTLIQSASDSTELNLFSVVGQDGAFASAGTVSDPGVKLIGSPGAIIPAPAAAMSGLVMLGGLLGRRRRA